MKRFVKVASLLRGPIEPAEVLDDDNQERAAARFDRDDAGLGEVVLWRKGMPYLDWGEASGDRRPKVSAELRSQLNGPRVALDEDWQKRRSRRA